jgi:hypothetical protein
LLRNLLDQQIARLLRNLLDRLSSL